MQEKWNIYSKIYSTDRNWPYSLEMRWGWNAHIFKIFQDISTAMGMSCILLWCICLLYPLVVSCSRRFMQDFSMSLQYFGSIRTIGHFYRMSPRGQPHDWHSWFWYQDGMGAMTAALLGLAAVVCKHGLMIISALDYGQGAPRMLFGVSLQNIIKEKESSNRAKIAVSSMYRQILMLWRD